MVNFPTIGLIKYQNRYIPTSCVSSITGDKYPEGKCAVTLANQVSPATVLLADVDASTFANSFILAQQTGKIIDVTA